VPEGQSDGNEREASLALLVGCALMLDADNLVT
jgi:hypothetical protein